MSFWHFLIPRAVCSTNHPLKKLSLQKIIHFANCLLDKSSVLQISYLKISLSKNCLFDKSYFRQILSREFLRRCETAAKKLINCDKFQNLCVRQNSLQAFWLKWADTFAAGADVINWRHWRHWRHRRHWRQWRSDDTNYNDDTDDCVFHISMRHWCDKQPRSWQRCCWWLLPNYTPKLFTCL